MHSPIIAPVVALVAWTMVMLLWMMALRLPAMRRAGIDLSTVSGGRPGILDTVLAEKTQWPAHNYIHLAEQPTAFYAVALSLALLGVTDCVTVGIAWAYVALRVGHSLVQATINRVAYRFLLFAGASIALIALTIKAAIVLLF